jgi:hypothetical protein
MSHIGSFGKSSSSGKAPVAAEELREWLLSREEPYKPLVNSRFVPTSDYADLVNTHVNASEALLSGSKISSKAGRGKASGKGKKESSCTYGARMPWLKVPSTRSFEFHSVELIDTATFLTSSTSVPSFASMAFSIASVPDFSSYSAVFDQYRITLIEVCIETQITEVLSQATACGSLITAIDVDDANTPGAITDLDAYSDVQMGRGTLSHYHRWVPTVAVAVYSGTFTSFASTTSMWLDCGSSGIQHYGLKAAATVSTQAQAYKLTYKLHCSWRARH